MYIQYLYIESRSKVGMHIQNGKGRKKKKEEKKEGFALTKP